MSNNSKIKKKAIALVQEWGAGKISIGTEFKLMGTDRILKLVESEGYPYGKLIFNDGEEFNIGKYFNYFFICCKMSYDIFIFKTRRNRFICKTIT